MDPTVTGVFESFASVNLLICWAQKLGETVCGTFILFFFSDGNPWNPGLLAIHGLDQRVDCYLVVNLKFCSSYSWILLFCLVPAKAKVQKTFGADGLGSFCELQWGHVIRRQCTFAPWPAGWEVVVARCGRDQVTELVLPLFKVLKKTFCWFGCDCQNELKRPSFERGG